MTIFIRYFLRLSLTDEQINLLNTQSQQKSLVVNQIDPSKRQSRPSSITTTTSTVYPNQQQTITASVPNQPQLNTTINLPQNLIEKSKINIQAEYQLKGSPVEEEEFIPSEPASRTDYKKKVLVNISLSIDIKSLSSII